MSSYQHLEKLFIAVSPIVRLKEIVLLCLNDYKLNIVLIFIQFLILTCYVPKTGPR
ncbi:hypothetical protein HanXRQr2_Chr00c023g0832991 [Helianthus annuus]|uniref:Uncharacterized protein n=1 Tax=Helianthus annuus TaxID=4232 RepID=A0A9K3P4F8_HELAN|nr:hypothetical protein HanXRQr2_Chr00c023g0832991 [Helianthus annuus]